MLQLIVLYKSKDPKSRDEEEMVENLFKIPVQFGDAHGKKGEVREGRGHRVDDYYNEANKKLDYGLSMMGLDISMMKFSPTCVWFVNALGMKTLFPYFMGKFPSE